MEVGWIKIVAMLHGQNICLVISGYVTVTGVHTKGPQCQAYQLCHGQIGQLCVPWVQQVGHPHRPVRQLAVLHQSKQIAVKNQPLGCAQNILFSESVEKVSTMICVGDPRGKLVLQVVGLCSPPEYGSNHIKPDGNAWQVRSWHNSRGLCQLVCNRELVATKLAVMDTSKASLHNISHTSACPGGVADHINLSIAKIWRHRCRDYWLKEMIQVWMIIVAGQKVVDIRVLPFQVINFVQKFRSDLSVKPPFPKNKVN